MPTVALLSGSLEYKSDECLTGYQPHLEKAGWTCVRLFRKADDDIPGLDKLATCDAALFFTRRLTLAGPQLDAVKAYCASGKPVVGVRTASHGFQNWLAMDAEVFGGDYKGHWKAGTTCTVMIAERKHPVLKDVRPFTSPGSLYKNPKLAADVMVLATGVAGDKSDSVVWVRERAVAGKTQRVFYTSLGHPDDFNPPEFRALLVNAIGHLTAKVRSTSKQAP